MSHSPGRSDSEPDGECFETAQEREAPPAHAIGRERHVGEAAHQLAERNLPFETRELRPEAEVDAVSEGEVIARVPTERVWEIQSPNVVRTRLIGRCRALPR